jgi:hypothetical protein
MKLLIDECLSEELAKLARDRGRSESAHVRWIGKAGAKDWELMEVILSGDWTFVTKNSIDFRGPSDAPGSKGEYRKTELHAGLVCLNGPIGMDLNMQLELFNTALDALEGDCDLVNCALEITLGHADDDEITIVHYALPAE